MAYRQDCYPIQWVKISNKSLSVHRSGGKELGEITLSNVNVLGIIWANGPNQSTIAEFLKIE